jgi:hypothetical protein
MRLLPLLLATLLLGACGTASETQDLPASSNATETAPTAPTTAVAPRPPAIVLVSAAGKQNAVLGTYCLSGAGTGVCADSAPTHPEEASVVPAAEHLSLLLVDGSPDGKWMVTVRRLGCERTEVATLDAASDEAFSLEVEPGDYQLDVTVRFKHGPGGTTGDVSGSVGLVVDPGSQPKIDPAPPGRTGC